MFSLVQYEALREGAGVVDRSDRGRLRVTGADRRSYLQGLLTNDIAALESGTGCYAAMLTAQGRMIADMRVLELGDAILIDLPGFVAPLVRDKLEQFVFSEDVVVSDLSGSLRQFGVYGPRAPEVVAATFARLASVGEPSPDVGRLRNMQNFENGRWDVAGAPATLSRSDDYGVDGFEIFVVSGSWQSVSDALLEGGAVAVNEATADVYRIEAGRPAFGKDMDDTTIPLEAGIEDRAISQTKGCYVGQEIIIRVLHRGHGRVARRLVGLLSDGSVPSSGDAIRSAEREIGAVTSAAQSPALGRVIALGYVHRDFVAPGTTLTVGLGSGQPAIVAALPLVPRHAEPVRP